MPNELIKLIIAVILIPLGIIYIFGVAKFVAVCFELVSDFFDALKWRMSLWIKRFKYDSDKK